MKIDKLEVAPIGKIRVVGYADGSEGWVVDDYKTTEEALERARRKNESAKNCPTIYFLVYNDKGACLNPEDKPEGDESR